jgi:integrase
VALELWLSGIELANGTKSKFKYVMTDVYQHGIHYGWLTREGNPVLAVRQSAKRERVTEPLGVPYADVEATSQNVRYRDRCSDDRLRISEVLGLKWKDIDWKHLQMNVIRSVVDAVVEKVQDRDLPTSCSVRSIYRHAN